MEYQKLTSGEKRILHSLLKGYSNARIASEFYVSVNTVKFHLKNIYRKMGVSNRIEAIIKSSQTLTKL